jgi:hypothetical protein
VSWCDLASKWQKAIIEVFAWSSTMTAATWWIIFRISRWALWLGTIAYYSFFMADRDSHLDQFGHLLITTEVWMFGLPLAAIFMGFFEMMMRERAGLPRPTFSRLMHPQDWPSPKSDPAARDKF